jgi:hypothetical protein
VRCLFGIQIVWLLAGVRVDEIEVVGAGRSFCILYVCLLFIIIGLRGGDPVACDIRITCAPTGRAITASRLVPVLILPVFVGMRVSLFSLHCAALCELLYKVLIMECSRLTARGSQSPWTSAERRFTRISKYQAATARPHMVHPPPLAYPRGFSQVRSSRDQAQAQAQVQAKQSRRNC